MNKKELIGFSLTMILLTISIAFAILLFCGMCYLLPYDFPGTIGEWITAFSALAGGALTLGGVWWTIKDSEKKRREDLAIQYKPIMSFENLLQSSYGMYYRDMSFSMSFYSIDNNEPEYIKLNAQPENKIKLIFSIKNIGRGNISNSIIKKCAIENPEYFDTHLMDASRCSFANLVPNQEAAIVLRFPKYLRLKNELLNNPNGVTTTVNVILEYTDEFNIHKFEYNIYLKINIEPKLTNYQSGKPNVSVVESIYTIEQVLPFLNEIK